MDLERDRWLQVKFFHEHIKDKTLRIDNFIESTVIEHEVNHTPKRSWRQWLIGRPLPTADAPHQTIGKKVGLAVFASDALSSTAYASQEIMMVLAIAGSGALGYVLPISVAIVFLMAIVTISYQQTIHAYPDGGGAYIVSRDNLGDFAAQTAAAALLTDYVLTVAVSISAGVAQITSAFPQLYTFRVEISVAMVLLVMVINLRGVKESGFAFAIPTYFFVITMFLTVGWGLYSHLTGTLGTVVNPPEYSLEGELTAVTLLLLLHAFSNGTAALTGIEAISNGITAFKEPRAKNAGITLIWMSSILASLFLGVSFISAKIHAVPSEIETVISQLARTVYGGEGLFYLAVIAGTAVILILAANTAFADFPRLSAIAASDGLLPRQLTFRGSRLVYSRGIISLAIIASLLIILFKASVTNLIPLYAIGVFLSFTLSQSGMAHRWWKSRKLKGDEQIVEKGSIIKAERYWKIKLLINSFGAVCTFIVMIVFAVTKFNHGAWIIVILIPMLVLIFASIHRHYTDLANKLSLDNYRTTSRITHHRVLVLIAGVHSGTMIALSYARSISSDITAVHVSIDPNETQKVREKWRIFGEGTRLVILESPYRLFIEPLMIFIEKLLSNQRQTEMLTIVVPQFVTEHWWENFLHNQTALMLRFALLFKRGLAIVEVPYNVQ